MTCLFCGSTCIEKAAFPRETRFNGKLFGYKRCGDCRLIFIDPLPNPDDYALMYHPEYHDTFYFETRKLSENHPIAALLKRFLPNGSVLDYGCGDGWILNSFVKQGFTGMGVEYDSGLVTRLRELYPQMVFETIGNVDVLGAQKPDVIHLGDVLEHLANPIEVVGKLKSFLEPRKGLLVVQGPLEGNAHLGLLVRKFLSALKGDVVSDHKPYHITFSNAANQLSFFERMGFETLYFKVEETPWPYPETRGGGIGEKSKYLVSKSSMALSRVLPGQLGNRFKYIGKAK